jgi:hypothetical protein
MKTVSFNKELIIANSLFTTIFNDIKISRFNKTGQITQTILVPVKYGDRSRLIKSVQNKSKNIVFPIITYKRTAIARFSERSSNLNDEILINSSDPTKRPPVPIELEFELNVYSNLLSDEDQIIQNIIPYFNNHIFISWDHPYTTKTIHNKVVWDGSFSNDKDADIEDSDIVKNISTATFKMYTWLFAGTTDQEINSSLIKTVKFSILNEAGDEINGGLIPVEYSENIDEVCDITKVYSRTSDTIVYP